MASPMSPAANTSPALGSRSARAAAKSGARDFVANTWSHTSVVASAGRTLTKRVRSHWDAMIPVTMSSGAKDSRWSPIAGRCAWSKAANTRWSSFAAAMPSLKYPGTTRVTSATRHQNASSSPKPARRRNAAMKFMLCTYPITGSCAAYAVRTLRRESHIGRPDGDIVVEKGGGEGGEEGEEVRGGGGGRRRVPGGNAGGGGRIRRTFARDATRARTGHDAGPARLAHPA